MVTKLHTLRAVEPAEFSYDDLPPDDRDAIRLHAIKIKLYGTMTVSAAAAIGLQLLEAKGRLPHGKFGPWLTHEFAWSDRTAREYISVYRFVAEITAEIDTADSVDLDQFDLGAIHRLVELKVPTDLRDYALDMVKDGQRVARRHLDAELARLRPAAAPTGRDRRPLADTREDRAGTPERPVDGTKDPSPAPVPGWSWPSLHVMPGDDEAAKAFAARIPAKDLDRARDLADAWAGYLDSVVVYIDERLAETPARPVRAAG